MLASPMLASPTWPKSGKLLVVLLIMLDTLKRVFGDAKPIDVWMLVIELLVLLLILVEFVWSGIDRYRKWRASKERRQEIEERLGALSPSEADALAAFSLRGQRPSSSDALSLAQRPSLIERHAFTGWCLVEEHKRFVKKWAKKRAAR
ncbi:MAG: hypothetical protein ABSH47_12435 [Bryobacteraceae bacterium]|jgi:hypothetical protein